MIITCLRSTLFSGGVDYPIFIGFAAAELLDQFCDAPSFPGDATNARLAGALTNPPVHDWQRPQDEGRIETIRRFFAEDSGEIMPNPVLLAASPIAGREVHAVRVRNAREVYEIRIPDPPPDVGQPKPLWILDGQHRIRGLAKSTQRQNDVPVVLLLDDIEDEAPVYSGQKFASLFAQVTTTATNLDEVHRDWLSYTYRLRPYGPDPSTARDYRDAMAAVIELCSRDAIPGRGRLPNPWYDTICFNPQLRATHKNEPFFFECHELREVLRKHYFSRSPRDRLTPDAVAHELMRARRALTEVLGTNVRQTVFFGPRGTSQRPMQDGFLQACLARMHQAGAGTDWGALLTGLRFDSTRWAFTWADTSGTLGTYSKKVAARGLALLFETGSLPTGARDVADYMKGSAAALTLEVDEMGSQGQRRRHGAGQIDHSLRPGQPRVIAAPSSNYVIRIDDAWKKRGNIAHIDVSRVTTSSGRTVEPSALLGAASAPGVPLGPLGSTGSLNCELTLHHYGGKQSTLPLSVTW